MDGGSAFPTPEVSDKTETEDVLASSAADEVIDAVVSAAVEETARNVAIVAAEDHSTKSASSSGDDALTSAVAEDVIDDVVSAVVHRTAEDVAHPRAVFGESGEVAVCVIGFHHTTGNVIESVFPGEFWPELDGNDELAFGGLPDGAHHAVDEDDWCYFTVRRKVGMWHGVTCVRQVDVTAMTDQKRAEMDATRGHVQKALCVLSSEPRYGELRDRLRAAALVFEGDTFDESKIATFHASLAAKREESVAFGCKRLFETLGAAASWRCVKALLLERSCVFVGGERSLSAASDLSLALVSLVPHALQASFDALTSPSSSVLDDDPTTSKEGSRRGGDQCGAWYLGSLVGERCRVEPSASLAHLGTLQDHVAKRRPGTLVVCGCSNPHLAKGHIAPLYSFDGDKPAAIVQLVSSSSAPKRSPSGPSLLLKGVVDSVVRGGGGSGNDDESSSSPTADRRDRQLATVSFFLAPKAPTGPTDAVSSALSSAFASGDSSDARRQKKKTTAPPTPGIDDDDDGGVEETGDSLASASWRPTKCEREYLDAIDDACRLEDFGAVGDGDVFCHKAALALVSRMVADVATTDPSDREGVADLTERWGGDFLYAWFTTTRSAAEWALVFAPSWSKLVARRRELSQLLRPNLVARLMHSSAHASQQIGRHAENLLSSTMTALNENIAAVTANPKAQPAKEVDGDKPPPPAAPTRRSRMSNWLAAATSRSASALEQASSARETASRALSDAREAAAPSISSLYTSLGDVATAAASYASRGGGGGGRTAANEEEDQPSFSDDEGDEEEEEDDDEGEEHSEAPAVDEGEENSEAQATAATEDPDEVAI